jgi:hypothetical protein
MDKFCIHCGSKIAADSTFCSSCGSSVPADKTPGLVVNEVNLDVAKNISKSVFPLYIFIPVLGLLLACGILVPFFLIWAKHGSGGKPDETSQRLGPQSESRLSANETSAIAALRALSTCQYLWRSEDGDKNDIPDFWTYDISNLFRKIKETHPIEMIDISLARADAAPHLDGLFGQDFSYDFAANGKPEPKSGYFFQAMLRDENGQFYNQNEVSGIAAANNSKFAFVAYPAQYGVTGKRTFIINDRGFVYAVDSGSDADKIVLQWPGSDPTVIEVVPGQKWVLILGENEGH